MSEDLTRTFESRLKNNSFETEVLKACATLFTKLQRCLFANIASGKNPNALKSKYLEEYQITARQFNALRVSVEGKISSIKTRQSALIVEKKDRIASLKKKIKHLIKVKKDKNIIHQKKRRLFKLEQELLQLKQDQENKKIRLCFGSKKLFRAQFDLEANEYTNHDEWLVDWQKERSKELFFLGSKDESSGNQTCTATLEQDNTLSLRIRLPNALFSQYGKYLVLKNVFFGYGQQEILTALCNKQALSWRFILDDKGWRVFCSFGIIPAVCTSNAALGVVGLDINVDHLALTETDRCGNPISTQTIPLNLKNKTSNQAKAIIGDAAACAIAYAQMTKKPLIIENLDFQKKKATIREERSAKLARMLSSFSYNSIITHLESRAIRMGVLVRQVNPAYTSLIGRVKFAYRYGLSIHHAAALCIGRRYLGYSEKPPLSPGKIPDGKDGHVTLELPVRNRTKHVWSFWRELSQRYSVASKKHFRTAKSRSKSTA